jgi:hypothetical protein
MTILNHVELKVEDYNGDDRLRTVCSILHVGRRGFVLEWMSGRDGLLWTVTTVDKRDIKRFVQRWRSLADRLRMRFTVHRSVLKFLT